MKTYFKAKQVPIFYVIEDKVLILFLRIRAMWV